MFIALIKSRKSNFPMVFSAINQIVTATQFYLYGKSHFTRTGWEKNIKAYDIPDILKNENLQLKDKVYMITGANAGIGREITDFLAVYNNYIIYFCLLSINVLCKQIIYAKLLIIIAEWGNNFIISFFILLIKLLF